MTESAQWADSVKIWEGRGGGRGGGGRGGGGGEARGGWGSSSSSDPNPPKNGRGGGADNTQTDIADTRLNRPRHWFSERKNFHSCLCLGFFLRLTFCGFYGHSNSAYIVERWEGTWLTPAQSLFQPPGSSSPPAPESGESIRLDPGAAALETTILQYTVMYCTVLYITVLHCNIWQSCVVHRRVVQCSASPRTVPPPRPAPPQPLLPTAQNRKRKSVLFILVTITPNLTLLSL